MEKARVLCDIMFMARKIKVTMVFLVLIGTLLLAGCGETTTHSNQTVEQKQEVTTTQENQSAEQKQEVTNTQGKNEAVEWYDKGNAFYKQGKYTEAIECYDKAIAIDPNYADAWGDNGTAFF